MCIRDSFKEGAVGFALQHERGFHLLWLVARPRAVNGSVKRRRQLLFELCSKLGFFLTTTGNFLIACRIVIHALWRVVAVRPTATLIALAAADSFLFNEPGAALKTFAAGAHHSPAPLSRVP